MPAAIYGQAAPDFIMCLYSSSLYCTWLHCRDVTIACVYNFNM